MAGWPSQWLAHHGKRGAEDAVPVTRAVRAPRPNRTGPVQKYSFSGLGIVPGRLQSRTGNCRPPPIPGDREPVGAECVFKEIASPGSKRAGPANGAGRGSASAPGSPAVRGNVAGVVATTSSKDGFMAPLHFGFEMHWGRAEGAGPADNSALCPAFGTPKHHPSDQAAAFCSAATADGVVCDD